MGELERRVKGTAENSGAYILLKLNVSQIIARYLDVTCPPQKKSRAAFHWEECKLLQKNEIYSFHLCGHVYHGLHQIHKKSM